MKTFVIAFNKPLGVISQFSSHDKYITLTKYMTEAGFYPPERLAIDSEGLMKPQCKLAKSYVL